MSLSDKIAELQKIINCSEKIVFFGGAGVSTESGIPDFRSVDGLYNQKYSFPPEEILSHSFFMKNTEEFYRFYRDKMICLDSKPNKAHLKLAELEEKGKLTAVITQNIDGLHQLAGSKTVYELHGSIHRNYCMSCGRSFNATDIKSSSGIPHCECGGIIKPDVVLYQEGLNENTLSMSVKALSEADTLIIGGTSLSVYPASGLIRYFIGKNLVIINMAQTDADKNANLLINDKIGAVFNQLEI